VFLCAALARRLFGEAAWKFVFLFALLAPTLVEMNGEILTEATATHSRRSFSFSSRNIF
jgi:hypothetical protein